MIGASHGRRIGLYAFRGVVGSTNLPRVAVEADGRVHIVQGRIGRRRLIEKGVGAVDGIFAVFVVEKLPSPPNEINHAVMEIKGLYKSST